MLGYYHPGRGTPPGTRRTPWDHAPSQDKGPPGPGTTPPGPGTHPCAMHAGRYGQQAGGMHPTGMHSCSHYFDVVMKRVLHSIVIAMATKQIGLMATDSGVHIMTTTAAM